MPVNIDPENIVMHVGSSQYVLSFSKWAKSECEQQQIFFGLLVHSFARRVRRHLTIGNSFSSVSTTGARIPLQSQSCTASQTAAALALAHTIHGPD